MQSCVYYSLEFHKIQGKSKLSYNVRKVEKYLKNMENSQMCDIMIFSLKKIKKLGVLL